MPGMTFSPETAAGNRLLAIDQWQIQIIDDRLLEITLIQGDPSGADDQEVQSMTRRFNIKSGGLLP